MAPGERLFVSDPYSEEAKTPPEYLPHRRKVHLGRLVKALRLYALLLLALSRIVPESLLSEVRFRAQRLALLDEAILASGLKPQTSLYLSLVRKTRAYELGKKHIVVLKGMLQP